MGYKADMKAINAYLRKKAGEKPNVIPKNSIEGRKRSPGKRWLKWLKTHREQWNAYKRVYMREWRKRKATAAQAFIGIVGVLFSNIIWV